MNHTYTIDLKWLEGRKGIMGSNVLNEKIEVATPPEFTGGMAGIWSPEHLFVAAAASCFMTTFLAVAEKSRLDFCSFSCHASGMLEKKNDKLVISGIVLGPLVKVSRQEMVGKAIKVLDLSHDSCLILNSVRSDIIFMPRVQCNDAFHSKASKSH